MTCYLAHICTMNFISSHISYTSQRNNFILLWNSNEHPHDAIDKVPLGGRGRWFHYHGQRSSHEIKTKPQVKRRTQAQEQKLNEGKLGITLRLCRDCFMTKHIENKKGSAAQRHSLKCALPSLQSTFCCVDYQIFLTWVSSWNSALLLSNSTVAMSFWTWLWYKTTDAIYELKRPTDST